MSFVKDDHGYTRGVGAIAATDRGSSNRRVAVARAARTMAARDAAFARAAMGLVPVTRQVPGVVRIIPGDQRSIRKAQSAVSAQPPASASAAIGSGVIPGAGILQQLQRVHMVKLPPGALPLTTPPPAAPPGTYPSQPPVAAPPPTPTPLPPVPLPSAGGGGVVSGGGSGGSSVDSSGGPAPPPDMPPLPDIPPVPDVTQVDTSAAAAQTPSKGRLLVYAAIGTGALWLLLRKKK